MSGLSLGTPLCYYCVMISYIEGIVVGCDDRGVTILTKGGIGYRVFLAGQDIESHPEEGEQVSFFTHLAVRDDALDLYGFPSERDLAMFRALLSVSGVGPKSAATILGQAGTETLIHAVRGQDAPYLTKTSGIGKKTAEKIVLELKDKQGLLPEGDKESTVTVGLGPESDALEALEALGYSARDVREIVRRAASEVSAVEDIIRIVLREMGK